MIEGKGTYALLLFLPEESFVVVGRLGGFSFPRGYYLYLGSALNGLHHRVARHLRREKVPHWHIDFLSHHASILQVWYDASQGRGRECLWRALVQDMPGAQSPVPGFGSSGCPCGSHLVHFASRPSFLALQRRLKRHGLRAERIYVEPRGQFGDGED